MTRFLRYSVEHDRKIRAVFFADGQLMQKTVKVLAFNQTELTLQLTGKKAPLVIPMTDLLSCAYARGDSGEE